MRLRAVFAGVAVAGVALGFAAQGEACAADALTAAKLGQKIGDVGFVDAAGKKITLDELKGAKATVVVFLSFECPVSTSYSPVLSDMKKHYADRGVSFVGVCASEAETPATVAKRATDFALAFPVYSDSQGLAVSAFKAEKTPEAFLLDHNLVLRYRGRVDDAFAARLKRNQQIKSHDLETALDEILAGKAVSRPVAEAIGCLIGAEKQIKKDGAVTYYRDVVPILQANCQECHRPGEIGPFSLMSFKEAVNWADDIKTYTETRQMPPWKITAGLPFHNERRLSDKDLTTLAKWVEDGTPEGKAADAPPARQFVSGWQLGEPDLIVTPTSEFVVGPGGPDLFRVFVMPTNLPEDKFVVGYEVKPANPRVVHHTLNFIDTTKAGRKLEEKAQAGESKTKSEHGWDRGPGYSSDMGVGFFPQGGLGGWAPGQLARQMPPGYGFLLPKHSDVVVQVHYHRDGRVEHDKLQIGLYFAKSTAGMKSFKGGVIPGRFLGIPANDSNYKVYGSTTVNEDCILHNITPHMHLVGKKIKVTIKFPNKPKETLLEIGSWDYNWQETYFLKDPLKLPKGTILDVEAIYDNSAKNPNNPNNPPKLVTFGEQTTNEMCFVFLGATSEGKERSPFGNPFGGGNRRGRQREKAKEAAKKAAEKQASR
jgi:peroxiredoxin